MNNVFIILVKPQLGQNIGSVARVMKNLNFKNLRIVNPRDGWPNQDVISTAAGADDVITNTKVFDNVSEACNDLNYLFASSARKRDLNELKSYLLKNLPSGSSFLIALKAVGAVNNDFILYSEMTLQNTPASGVPTGLPSKSKVVHPLNSGAYTMYE